MSSVHEAINISYSNLLRCQGSRDCQSQTSVTWSLFNGIHGSFAFPILPIDVENLSRLSERTLSMISISYLFKFVNIAPHLITVLPQVSRDWWAIISKAGIRFLINHFWRVIGYNMQLTLLWCFYLNWIITVLHFYASLFCFNLIFCHVVSA